MLIDTKSKINLAELQFLIAIELDNLGFKTASQSVLAFLTDKPDSVKLRLDLQKELECRSKHGLLYDFIDYLWNNEVLLSVSRSETKRYEVTAALKDLASGTTVDAIYTRCMQDLFYYQKRDFILLYSKTNTFREEFVNKIVYQINASFSIRENFREEDRDAAALEIYALFLSITERYYCSGYNIESFTPINYLANAFKKYFVLSYSTEIYAILNRRGADNTLSDNKTTNMALQGVEVTKPAVSLDFRDVAMKICKSSQALFSHQHGSVIYSNIVALYKSQIIETKMNEPSTRKVLQGLYGLNIHYECTGSLDCIKATGPTVKPKFVVRKDCCKLVADAVLNNNGIPIHTLYTNLISLCSKVVDKEARRLFNVGEGNGGGVDMSNGEIFEAMLNGYHALKQLIGYIESKPEKDLNIFSIPERAFMDPQTARRYDTLENYCKLEKTVTELVTTANCTEGYRYTDKVGSIKSNDSLYDNFCIPGLTVQATYKQFINKNPVVNLKKIVEGKRDEVQRTAYTNIAAKCNRIFWDGALASSKYKSISYAVCSPAHNVSRVDAEMRRCFGAPILNDLASCTTAFNLCCIEFINITQSESKGYVIRNEAIALISILLRLTELEGHPLVNSSGQFTIKCVQQEQALDNIFDYLLPEDKTDTVAMSKAKSNIGNRLAAISEAYRFLTQEEINNDVKDLYALVSIVYTLQFYLNNIGCLLYRTYNIKSSNNFLALVYASQYRGVLNMKKQVANYQELLLLRSKEAIQCSLEDYDCLKDLNDITRQAYSKVVKAYNIYFDAIYDAIIKPLDNLAQGIDSCIYFQGNTVTEDTTDLDILRNVNSMLNMSAMYNTRSSISVQFESAFSDSFDDLGYLVHNAHRYIRNDSYYHKSGHIITVDRFRHRVSAIKEMDAAALNSLKLDLKARSFA